MGIVYELAAQLCNTHVGNYVSVRCPWLVLTPSAGQHQSEKMWHVFLAVQASTLRLHGQPSGHGLILHPALWNLN